MTELTTIKAHRPGPIAPIVLPGENVGLWVANAWRFYQVLRLEPLQYSAALTQDFGSLAANTSDSSKTRASVLETDSNHFQQIRMAVLDDFRVQVFQPLASARYGNVDGISQISLSSKLVDPDAALSEIFVFEDNEPHFLRENPTDAALGQTRIRYWGIQYLVEPLPEEKDENGNPKLPARATKLMAAGLAS